MNVPKVTEKSFYKYLKCPSWLIHEVEDQQVHAPLLDLLQDEGLLPDQELALLKGKKPIRVEMDDADEAAQKTLELMKEGVQTIHRGVLMHGRYIARPDVLERVEGHSDLGDYYYVACDMKRSSQLKNEYKFQGVFYAEVLKKVQGTRPTQGYVLHRNGLVDGYLIQDFEAEYHLTLEEIEKILDEKKHGVFLTSACKQSPWFSECVARTEACRDLSLLNRIWRSEVRALQEGGIQTIDQLADAKIEVLKKVRDMTMDRLYFLQQQAISLVDDRIIHIGQVDLPEDTPVTLVIDIESDPLHDLHYMFGILIVDAHSQDYIVHTAESPKNEEKNWQEFLRTMQQYPNANIYHYGWYEVDVFRKMTEKYGAPPEVIQMFENQLIDLLTHMRNHIIFPSPFYSLKDIAKYLGFAWRIKDASGIDSIVWYEQWLKTGDRAFLKDIQDYNEDDVRATWHVREWIRGQQS